MPGKNTIKPYLEKLVKEGILNKNRLELALKSKEFFLVLLNCNIEKICIENPVPSKVVGLPEYNQTIEPYYFGDSAQKKTCLWLKSLEYLQYKLEDDLFGKSTATDKYESTKIPGNWFNKGGKNRQQNRSRTFQGIANAMAGQWG